MSWQRWIDGLNQPLVDYHDPKQGIQNWEYIEETMYNPRKDEFGIQCQGRTAVIIRNFSEHFPSAEANDEFYTFRNLEIETMWDGVIFVDELKIGEV